MNLYLNEIILGLYVMNLGVAFGAGIYETRITLPLWFNSPSKNDLRIDKEMIIKMNVGRRFWGFATTIPLTMLTLIGIIIVFRQHGLLMEFWLAALLIILIERFGTFFYFIPTIIKMTKPEKLSENKQSGMAWHWMRMNNLRLAFNLAGWLLAMVAFILCIKSTS